MANRDSNKALYRQIYEELRSGIINEAYPGGEFLPSERELCEKFSVDRITVRKSLELLVQDGLVEKKAGLGTRVKELPLKHTAKSDSTNIMFVLPKSRNSVDRITEVFNSSLFYRTEKECAKKGYSLIYTTLGDDDDFSRLSNGGSIRGILFVSKINERYFVECKRANMPAVVVNNYYDGLTSVTADNENGAYKAVMSLCQHGHRRVGMILGTHGYFNASGRLNGYKKALAEANIGWQQQAVKDGNWTFEAGFIAMKEILSMDGPKPTAIFAANDMMAIGAMEAIKEQGLSVPGDYSIIGFDNVEQCEYTHPRLSSIAVDIDIMARAACQQLFENISTGTSLNLKITIPAKLAARRSVGKPHTG